MKLIGIIIVIILMSILANSMYDVSRPEHYNLAVCHDFLDYKDDNFTIARSLEYRGYQREAKELREETNKLLSDCDSTMQHMRDDN
jgi:hypothetical protein